MQKWHQKSNILYLYNLWLLTFVFLFFASLQTCRNSNLLGTCVSLSCLSFSGGDIEAQRNCRWVWKLPIWQFLSLEHVDTNSHDTNTCLSFYACQLVHPAEQGEYASYFEPNLQQVEEADINGASSLCDSSGLGSEWRRVFSYFSIWNLCWYPCISKGVFLHSELIQPSATSVNWQDFSFLLPGIPPNISPLSSPCHSPIQGTPATSPTGKTSSVSFPDYSDIDTKQGLKPHKVLTSTQSAPSLSDPIMSPSVICSRYDSNFTCIGVILRWSHDQVPLAHIQVSVICYRIVYWYFTIYKQFLVCE